MRVSAPYNKFLLATTTIGSDVLVLEGGFTKYDRFVYLPIGEDEGMLKVWQYAILSLFLRKELIDKARVNMLKGWKHSGFSIESETRLFSKADREAACQ